MSTPVHAPAQARANASPTPQTGTLSRATREQETAEPVPESVHEAVRSGGQPLDAGTRETMGVRFGHDFSKVRVHTDEQAAESARDIRANAYTLGDNIAFANNMYAPHTTRGQALLVHELTHIVQSARHPAIAPIIAPAHHPAEQEAAATMHNPFLMPSAAPGGMVHRQLSGILDTGKEALTKSLEIEEAEIRGEAAFVISFIESARATIPPDAFQRLDQELRQPVNAAKFAAGEIAGILVGAGKDLVGTIGTLLELAVKTTPAYQIGSELRSLYQKGAHDYLQEKQKKYEETRALIAGLKDFVQAVVHDPNVLVQIGGDLGAAAGKRSGEWFKGDFMEMKPFYKGETVGEVMGYILMEIVLLFVGPEELAIRGAAWAGKAAESTKLGRAVLAALEKIPALAKILEARKLLKVGGEAANITEKGVTAAEKGLVGAEKATATATKEASHLTTDVEKGASKVEGATHAATSAEQKVAGAGKGTSKLEEAAHAPASAEQKATGAEKDATKVEEATKETASTQKQAAKAEEEAETTSSTQQQASQGQQTGTLVGRSTSQMRRAATQKIKNTPNHPLKFLLDKDGKFFRTRGLKHAELADNPALVQMGHITSNKAGQTERIMLQGAWENQLNNISVEHPSIGGSMTNEAIDIGGIAVDVKTARFWEDIGKLPKGTVASAPKVP